MGALRSIYKKSNYYGELCWCWNRRASSILGDVTTDCRIWNSLPSRYDFHVTLKVPISLTFKFVSSTIMPGYGYQKAWPLRWPLHLTSKICFFVITHGITLPNRYLQPADVAIYCADPTTESKLDEIESAVQLLERIDAPQVSYCWKATISLLIRLCSRRRLQKPVHHWT